MCIRPKARSTAAGFTLLEVIIAMALITLLIGGVYGIANAAMRLGASMSKARLSETRLTNFTQAWRAYLESLPPGIRLTCGLQKVSRGAAGRLLIEGGEPPFAWTRAVRLADAVEFSVIKGAGPQSLALRVTHLKRLEKPTVMDAYEPIAELVLLEDLEEFRWEFYEAAKKRWFNSWDPEKHEAPPLFMRLHFRFLGSPHEHEHTFWIANDLTPPAPPAAEPRPGAPAAPSGAVTN